MSKCAVQNCKINRYRASKTNVDIIIHSFPKQQDLYQKWVKFCGQDKNWKPSAYVGICSNHFRNEDYQVYSLVENKKRSRMLFPNAIPSIFKSTPYSECVKREPTTGESHAKIVRREANSADSVAVPSIKKGVNSTQIQEASVGESIPLDSVVLKYRDQCCRTCLKPCQDSSATPIESKIQNTTLLDMFVHLTAFETEYNDVFPSVICLECKICLVQAFNVRQEFIAKAEFLVQLVAENKLAEYIHSSTTKTQTSIKPIAPMRFIFAGTDETSGYPSTKPLVPIHSPTSNNLITKSIKLKAPKQFIFTDINQAFRNLSANHLVSNDNATLQRTLGENNAETNKNDIEQHESDASDSNDHSCYNKVVEGNGNLVKKNDDRQQNCLAESQAEDACKSSSTLETMVDYEKEKSMKRKLTTGQQRALKAQQGRKVIKKTNRLEEEARRMFPFTTCYVCDKQHDSMMECNFHMREHIPMLPYQCNECMVENNKAEATEIGEKYQPMELKTLNKLNLHFRMHRLPHKCDKCYRRFSTTTKLNAHISNVHAFLGTGLTCEYCGKQYFDRTTFRTHVANHRNELSGQYKCLICNRTFGTKDCLKRHEVSHTGEKKYKCMYCDNSYSRSYNLLIHHRTHTGERPHKCLECGQAFPQRNALLRHVCTPGQVKPPKYRSRLKVALLPSKDGRCPYPDCDYTASTYGAMYMHRRTKHRPLYQCEVCKKSFAFENQLNEHSRLHTGEKPYPCSICGRSFRTSQVHRNHLKTHSTDSNFACEICQKSFSLPARLRQHMLTHSSERKFSCEICGNSYKTKGELTKHIQRKHGDENNEITNEDENLQ